MLVRKMSKIRATFVTSVSMPSSRDWREMLHGILGVTTVSFHP